MFFAVIFVPLIVFLTMNKARSQEIRVTDFSDFKTPTSSYTSDIDGDKIVYHQENRTVDVPHYDIFMYDLLTGIEIPICIAPGNQTWPRISGNRIVWIDKRSDKAGVFMYDLDSETETRITDELFHYMPGIDIDGDRIVYWSNDVSIKAQVYMFYISTGVETLIFADPEKHFDDPMISGENIICSSGSGIPQNIYISNLSTGNITQITYDGNNHRRYAISGNYIAIAEAPYPTENWSIYLYNITTGNRIEIASNLGWGFSRIDINGESIFAEYNIVCNEGNAILIDRNDRVKQLPHSARNNGVGHGQKSVWYVDKPERQELKDDLLDYIEDIINQADSSDEYKHHLHDESRTYITSTKQIYRSQAAKADCIRLKGCYCNICGFDFEKTYGEMGKDYIEVHHITPIGRLSTAEGYEGTDPQNDLIPLCSNCHSMIHRRKEPYQPNEVKAMLGK